MYKLALAILFGYTTVTYASTLEFQNLTGASITASPSLTISPGNTRVEITTLISNEWHTAYGGTMGDITDTNSYVATFTGYASELSVVADSSNPVRSWTWFWTGMGAFTLFGFSAIAMRWVRLIIGGGGNYE